MSKCALLILALTVDIVSAGDSSVLKGTAGELLYNGIRLPAVWPPRDFKVGDELAPPPYLKQVPKVIPIDVGRQLFVDDFLIASTTLTRTFHKPEKYHGNPVRRRKEKK
jgi:hypothetical protein